MKSVLKNNTIYISLLLVITVIWAIISFNSYGTGDVKLWLYFAQYFNSTGFWPNYFKLTDIPMLATMYVYFAGLVTKFIFGTINEFTFPGILKMLQYPFLLATLYMTLKIGGRKKITGQKMLLPVTLMILLNPAIIMNLGFLGYLDVLYVFSLVGCIYFLDITNSNVSTSKTYTFLFALLFFIALFIKPQFIMFAPILIIYGIIIFSKQKTIKQFISGLIVGIILLSVLVSWGCNSVQEFVTRFTWTKDIFKDRILGQAFVVANFPNFWQGYNFFYHNCIDGCNFNDFLFKPLTYWLDKPLALSGKKLFFISGSIYGVLFIRALFSKHSNKVRRSPIKIVILSSILMNIIYSYFNTSVHENHLIATVFLSTILFKLDPNKKNIYMFLFFTLLNFINLFFYYNFGLSGFFGYTPKINYLGLNINNILLIVYTLFLGIKTLRINKGYLD